MDMDDEERANLITACISGALAVALLGYVIVMLIKDMLIR